MARIEIIDGRVVVKGRDIAGLDGLGVLKVRRPDQMRWKDGSYLTVPQVEDEEWNKRDDAEQRRVQSL